MDDYGFIRYEMGYAAAISVVLLIFVWLISKVANKLFKED
jgi:multiple sugar transport system permease protein